jgi:hypothetical protein
MMKETVRVVFLACIGLGGVGMDCFTQDKMTFERSWIAFTRFATQKLLVH